MGDSIGNLSRDKNVLMRYGFTLLRFFIFSKFLVKNISK